VKLLRNRRAASTVLVGGATHKDSLNKPSSVDRAARRALDILMATILLVLLLPLLLALALVVRLDSRGPSFYRSSRVGAGRRPLRMLKFRKMLDNAAGSPLTSPDDERFTRVGRFLARTKLDELPQLLHVIRGNMSLVGPRPEDPVFVRLHDEDYEGILRVKPGITGFSQLAFARESEILDSENRLLHYEAKVLPQKVKLDALYASRASLRLNLQILYWTFVAVALRRAVAVNRSDGTLSRRAPRTPAAEMQQRVEAA
jgi:lipopolysaccharide/colanic/teichoic acid biosynthesis glycosyltransferase